MVEMSKIVFEECELPKSKDGKLVLTCKLSVGFMLNNAKIFDKMSKFDEVKEPIAFMKEVVDLLDDRVLYDGKPYLKANYENMTIDDLMLVLGKVLG